MPLEPIRIIAVVGATGAQGGGVVRALQEQGKFTVRALTRNPENAAGLADAVVAADLIRPETLTAAFAGAYGVFVNTNSFGGPDVDEIAQGTAAVEAALEANVEHFIWSTLPSVAEINLDRHRCHSPHVHQRHVDGSAEHGCAAPEGRADRWVVA